MQVPKWFVIGCSLVLLNFVLVLSTVVVRHATAGPPSSSSDKVADKAPELPPHENVPANGTDISTTEPTVPPSEGSPLTAMPAVPSIENLPPAGTTAAPNSSLLSLEDFKRVFTNDTGAMLPGDGQAPSQQLTQGYFEALELRLESVGNLNEAAKDLVREAAILYQRGEITESRNLLGKATQLRELAAQLLVTRQ